MARRRKQSFHLSLDAETRRGIGVVLLFAFAFLLLLSFFNLAGTFGRGLDEGISHVFGWDKLLVPFFLIAWGCSITSPEQFPIRFTNVLGAILFFASANPLIHLVSFSQGLPVADPALAVAGGKLGELLAVPFVGMFGAAGTAVFAGALLIISLLLLFNATLSQVLFVFAWIGKALKMLMDALIRAWGEAKRKRLERASQTQEVRVAEVRQTTVPEPVRKDATKSRDEEDEEEDDEMEEDEETVATSRPRKRYPRIEIPLELLEKRDQRPTSGDINHNREVIRRTLETFGIPVDMREVSVGPTVTQFALKPSDGVKLARITALHNDLALSLAAHPIRIEAPIPGKSLVGIEVPNQSVATVGVREILESKEFRERKTPITFALGKDVSGKPWTADLSKMPHLLVAGATGSGKSVCLNTVIMSFLYACGPDDLKFIMVDPKRVELQVYNGIPHLITPVITKVPETVNALKWALREMDRRYDLLSKHGTRDLLSYNERMQERLPYVVIVIDELADLMATAANEVEGPIVRLAQMARAVGIHMILATQRPSVDVITGLIKANFPGRIAFAVASATDSRTILDQQGAEKLLGRGDMLFSTAELSTPKRIQGTFISDLEIGRVVEFIKSKYDPADYDPSVIERSSGGGTIFSGGGGGDDDSDPLILDAKEEILRAGKASASLLQRRLKVGYARAARLLDLLEEEGFIGPADGAKPREILQADFVQDREETPSSEEDVNEEGDDSRVEEESAE